MIKTANIRVGNIISIVFTMQPKGLVNQSLLLALESAKVFIVNTNYVSTVFVHKNL